MKALSIAGIVLVSVAIGTCLLLGTFGWFAVGFSMMTDCTNNYNCTATSCTPCATTGRWINAGGIAQWVLAGMGVVVLRTGMRAKQRAYLVGGGGMLLAMSVLTIAGTTWLAQESYCQPGTPGYISSYCSTAD
ncbi:MAG TPA: hypothetical protein VFJ14_09975 [Nocardioidaceae bacterium]|nr:hypothetical protein [Nocardioidaceae bacterium]